MSLEFLENLGQTNPFPFLIEVDRAEGIYIYDKSGKAYMDMISGVAVNNLGHGNFHILNAIRKQIDKHLHVMVYGEFVQDAEIEFSKELLKILPPQLNCVYPVNSGTEANEAALKLAKRITGRSEIISFRGAYHGSTHGSLSVGGNELKKRDFRPLLPDVNFIELNNFDDLNLISSKTACVILETIQGDAGVRTPSLDYMKALRKHCTENGCLLILDEIQCGMGRTARNFAFEKYNIVPDILTLGKALGGGMPIGALVSSRDNLRAFSHSPMLGHITTFGGHPVVCAAAAAFLQELEKVDYSEVERLGQLLQDKISSHQEIVASRREGMMFAFDMVSFERVEKVVKKCLEKGLISFWFLSHPYSFRLSPPINITEEEVLKAADIIISCIDETK